MKNFKKITLGILGAALLALGLYSCNNDESKDLKTQNTELLNNPVQARLTGGYFKFGEIVNGKFVSLVDLNAIKTEMLNEGLFSEIESVEINENYLTIIGKDVDSFNLVAFQAKFTKIGSDVLLQNSEYSPLVAQTHSCAGNGCSSCAFIEDDKGKKIGCECKAGGGTCDHSVTDDGKNPDITDKPKTKIWDTLLKVAEIIAKFIK